MSKKDSEQRKLSILSDDDQYPYLEVGTWAEEKYQSIGSYCEMFSTSMKNKWDSLVYLDLFAGAGKCLIPDAQKALLGSPLLALNAPDPFTKYIFCESDPERMEALSKRVKKYFPEKDCYFVPNNCNESVEQILSYIPKHSPTHKVLTYCLVDPYKVSQLDFSTFRSISTKFVDFIVLVPSFMDINRNIGNYLREDDLTLDRFLGYKDWRVEWRRKRENPKRFIYFILDCFCRQMKGLGYLYENPEDFILIKNEEDKKQPLYHLVFFTRNKLGLEFWRKIKDNMTKQRILPFLD